MSKVDCPLVSICIPVFNGSAFIREAIDSALNQTYQHIEIVISDNASTDDTPLIIKSFPNPQIKYFRNDINVGSIKNFNICLKKASGTFFLLLPHDDRLPLNAVQSYLDDVYRTSKVFGFSNYNKIDADSNFLVSHINNSANYIFDQADFVNFVVDKFNPIQSAFSFTRAIRDVGGYDPEYGIFCDVHLWLKLSEKFQGCFSSNQILYEIRSHSSQGQVIIDDPDKVFSHFPDSFDTKSVSYQIFFLRFYQYLVTNFPHLINNKNLIKNLILPYLLRSLKNRYNYTIFKSSSFKSVLPELMILFKPFFHDSYLRGFLSVAFLIFYLLWFSVRWFYNRLKSS